MRKLVFPLVFLACLCFSGCETELPDASYNNRYTSQLFDSVIVTKNVYYRTARTISGDKVNLFFDFSEPFNDSANKRPLIVLMHGGGFIQGHRGWMDSLALWLPKYGYSCANISYRLYDGSDYPLSNEDFLMALLMAREDLVSAINYFISHASGIDPYKTDVDNIFIAGTSAGGIAALHAIDLTSTGITLSKRSNKLFESRNAHSSMNLNAPEKQVRGILSFSGAIIDTNLVAEEYPFVFCVHGTDDRIVPFSAGSIQITGIISPFPAFGSEIICKLARDMGKEAVLIPDPGAGHDNYLKKGHLWKEEAIEFLYNSLK